jgi:hypothetical protein
MNDQQLTIQNSPFSPTTWVEVEKIAAHMADAHAYGFKKPSQVISAMLLAHESGKSLSVIMEEKHFFEDGKISPKASHMQATFQKTGTILWHIRTSSVVAGSFFAYKPIKDEDRARACARFELQYELDIMQMQPEWSIERESELLLALSRLARENECTIIRTMAQAAALGLANKTNYNLGAANMHQWRCVSDAIKLIDPAALAGGSPDVDIQDLSMLEKPRQITITTQSRDKEAVKSMMTQHMEDASMATGMRKQELLGLASELRCKLSEMEPQQESLRPESKPIPKIVDATDATVELADDDQLPGIEPAPKFNKWQDYEVTKYGNKRLGSLSKEEVSVLHAAYQKKNLTIAKPEVRREASMIAMAFEALSTTNT